MMEARLRIHAQHLIMVKLKIILLIFQAVQVLLPHQVRLLKIWCLHNLRELGKLSSGTYIILLEQEAAIVARSRFAITR